MRGPRAVTRAALVAVLVGAAIWLGMAAPVALATPAAGPAAAAPRGAVVVIGTGGLSWADVSPSATPNLWTLLRDGSSAVLTTRSVYHNACPTDGWLGFGAGARAAAPREGDPNTAACPPLAQPTPTATTGHPDPTTVPGWSSYLGAADSTKFNAHLGLIGDLSHEAQFCVAAVGPGAALGAARHDGAVDRYAAYSPATLLTDLAACPLTMVDVGAVVDPDDLAEGERPPAADRATQIKAVDQRIGEVIAAGPAGADYLVASLSDASQSERLRLAVVRGPHFGPGTLVSPSTRQPGLIQVSDLTATVLHLSNLTAPAGLGGATLSTKLAQDNSEARAQVRHTQLTDIERASYEVHPLVSPFFSVFGYGQLVIYLFVFLVWKGRIGSALDRVKVLDRVRTVGVVAACVPASTYLANLVPWWRFPVPMLAVLAVVAVWTAAIAAVALHGPWSRYAVGPLAAVAALTATVLGADVMLGSRLQQSSLMGLQPVVAGRFYGMSNVAFGLFATSALLLAMAISSLLVRRHHPRVAVAAVAVIGLAAIVIDGAPFWGADGGGPPALIAGLAVLILGILQVRLTWRRALLIAVGAAALFLLVAWLDWLRAPDSRTHLGNFIQAIIDGTAGDIVKRKALQNLSILTRNMPLTLLVPASLLFVTYVLARPTSWGSRALQRSYRGVPTLQAGLRALLVMLTIGFLINDSGTAIPAVGATIAVPLMVSLVARTLGDEVRSSAQTRAGRRGVSRSAIATPPDPPPPAD